MPILPVLLLISMASERWLTLGQRPPDLALFDSRGAVHNIAEAAGRRGTVLYFFASGCPLAKLYTPRIQALASDVRADDIRFVGIASQPTDSLADLETFARTHRLSLPVWKDRNGALAAALGIRRTPEVLVLDAEGRIRYRGRIDDQYQPGITRSAVSSHDLRDALAQLAAGEIISRPITQPAGCLLGRVERGNGSSEVVYTRDIAPVLNQNCRTCHRQDQIGPFPLTTYEEAAGWGPMIREVVQDRRMPPWHANPAHGRFLNERRLSDRDRQLITTWVDNGCPEGDAGHLPIVPSFPKEWSIGQPDLVLSLPAPIPVSSEGSDGYRFFEIDPGFTEDRWIRAAELMPTCKAVVTQCNVFLKPPTKQQLDRSTEAEWTYLTVLTPGQSPTVLPDGVAKRWPAGWRAVIEIRYSPNGSPHEDQTRLGLLFAEPETVRQELSTQLTRDEDIAIAPGASDVKITHKFVCKRDSLIFAIVPHMHLRGRSFRTEVEYPDGRRSILLDVPRYEFAWQTSYAFAEPVRLARGTVVYHTGTYDNSSGNPANPDATAWVRTGLQPWNEMFNVYVDIVSADQDLPADARRSRQWLAGGAAGAIVVSLGTFFWWLQRCKIHEKTA
jgi:peroxiredoxin